MISKKILEQLRKCVFANINNYDEKTNTFYIPKYSKPKYDVGKCYLIKLPGNIVKNPNSLLATNWNNGSAPQFEYMKVYVSKTMGTYIYVDAVYYDFINKQDMSLMWSGYLNSEELTQIDEVK